MLSILIIGATFLTVGPKGTPPPQAAAASAPDGQTHLAEYNALRTDAPDTVEAHWKLGLWCEQKGLKAEAVAEFSAVVRLDPGRDAAWKKLGYEKRNGRWVTSEQVASERAETAAQRKADARWRPLLARWKGWLAERGTRAEGETALAGVDDPRAVPSVWKVFATGTPEDQERAIDVFGHIEGERASRALAGLAVFGRTDLVRRAAVETLTRRDPNDVLMCWIGLLQKPTKYEVRQVAGPGSPGVLLTEGRQFNVRRYYAPPSVQQTESLFVDGGEMGRPTLPLQFNSSPPGPPAGAREVGFADGKDLYVFHYLWAPPAPPPKKIADPTPAYQEFERSQLQATLNRDFEFTEAAKMAAGAQARLQHDVDAIEADNAVIRERNARLVEALRRVSGKDYGEDREAWLKWWMERRGYTYIPPRDQPKATIDVRVPLPYVPQNGPPVLGSGGGGGGHGWCMVWEHDKGQRPTTGNCFAAGTPVHTPGGLREIQTLRAGDLVLTRDGPRSRVTGSILSVHQSTAPQTLRLILRGEVVVTTEGHPFWRQGRGWTRAGDLKPSDEILTGDGPIQVTAIEVGGDETVWNLRVDDGASFFVGRLGLLVHDISPVEEVDLSRSDAPFVDEAIRRAPSAPCFP
jgi:hypothetical protein